MKHRGMHRYDSEGRDRDIESYILETLKWSMNCIYSSHLPDVSEMCFVDVGCDYGYAMNEAEQYFASVWGLEPNRPEKVPVDFEYLQDQVEYTTIESSQLSFDDKPRVYFLNHVLEHFEAPIPALRKIMSDPLFAGMLIATPDALSDTDDFVYRDSHLSLFTEKWHKLIGSRIVPSVKLVDTSVKTLRDDKREVWAFYAKE